MGIKLVPFLISLRKGTGSLGLNHLDKHAVIQGNNNLLKRKHKAESNVVPASGSKVGLVLKEDNKREGNQEDMAITGTRNPRLISQKILPVRIRVVQIFM